MEMFRTKDLIPGAFRFHGPGKVLYRHQCSIWFRTATQSSLGVALVSSVHFILDNVERAWITTDNVCLLATIPAITIVVLAPGVKGDHPAATVGDSLAFPKEGVGVGVRAGLGDPERTSRWEDSPGAASEEEVSLF